MLASHAHDRAHAPVTWLLTDVLCQTRRTHLALCGLYALLQAMEDAQLRGHRQQLSGVPSSMGSHHHTPHVVVTSVGSAGDAAVTDAEKSRVVPLAVRVGLSLFFQLLRTVSAKSFTAVLAALPRMLQELPPLALAPHTVLAVDVTSAVEPSPHNRATTGKSRRGAAVATAPGDAGGSVSTVVHELCTALEAHLIVDSGSSDAESKGSEARRVSTSTRPSVLGGGPVPGNVDAAACGRRSLASLLGIAVKRGHLPQLLHVLDLLLFHSTHRVNSKANGGGKPRHVRQLADALVQQCSDAVRRCGAANSASGDAGDGVEVLPYLKELGCVASDGSSHSGGGGGGGAVGSTRSTAHTANNDASSDGSLRVLWCGTRSVGATVQQQQLRPVFDSHFAAQVRGGVGACVLLWVAASM